MVGLESCSYWIGSNCNLAVAWLTAKELPVGTGFGVDPELAPTVNIHSRGRRCVSRAAEAALPALERPGLIGDSVFPVVARAVVARRHVAHAAVAEAIALFAYGAHFVISRLAALAERAS